jgi:hypothetical protein
MKKLPLIPEELNVDDVKDLQTLVSGPTYQALEKFIKIRIHNLREECYSAARDNAPETAKSRADQTEILYELLEEFDNFRKDVENEE